MNYKHPHNSLANIHNPCKKNMLDMRILILIKNHKTHIMNTTNPNSGYLEPLLSPQNN